MGMELVEAEAVIKLIFWGLVFVGAICAIALIVKRNKQKS